MYWSMRIFNTESMQPHGTRKQSRRDSTSTDSARKDFPKRGRCSCFIDRRFKDGSLSLWGNLAHGTKEGFQQRTAFIVEHTGDEMGCMVETFVLNDVV